MEEVSLYDIAVVGAGPAGMCAAIEASLLGARVCIVDRNYKAGGQLFKQIHKFFGSDAHYAGQRGFEIGDILLDKLKKCTGVDIFLESTVFNVCRETSNLKTKENDLFTLWISKNDNKLLKVFAKNIIISTGASEKSLFFEGWTLPGVMGAGAISTYDWVWKCGANCIIPAAAGWSRGCRYSRGDEKYWGIQSTC